MTNVHTNNQYIFLMNIYNKNKCKGKTRTQNWTNKIMWNEIQKHHCKTPKADQEGNEDEGK